MYHTTDLPWLPSLKKQTLNISPPTQGMFWLFSVACCTLIYEHDTSALFITDHPGVTNPIRLFNPPNLVPGSRPYASISRADPTR